MQSVWADSLRSESDFNSQEPGEVEMAATMDLLQGQSNVEWQAKFEAHLLHEAYAKVSDSAHVFFVQNTTTDCGT
jgi:hypothetical protein